MASKLRRAPGPTDAAFHRERTLAGLMPGAYGFVRDIRAPEAMRERLAELGLLPGTRVDCLFESPMGDPRAYRIRGIVLAIRAADAAAVTLDGVQA